MKVKVGDNVKILAGKDKGKEGRIVRILKKDNKVVVDGINMVKKHVKPNRMNEVGSIVDIEAPIHISNVKLAETKKEAKKEVKKAAAKPVEEKKTTKKTTKKSEKKAS